MAVIGIDSHKDVLAGCLVDTAGQAVEYRSIANTDAGHAELVEWARAVGASRVGIEGAGNYGRPAAQQLLGAGVAVVEVPPQMTAAARRGRRTGSKSDQVDATEIARAELLPVEYAGTHGHIPRPSLLGAIICKAAAVPVHRDRQIQLGDLALLLSLVADPPAMAPELSHKDRVRLRGAAEIAAPDHAVWHELPGPAAAQARLALRTLLPGAAPAASPTAGAPVEHSPSPSESPEPGNLDI